MVSKAMTSATLNLIYFCLEKYYFVQQISPEIFDRKTGKLITDKKERIFSSSVVVWFVAGILRTQPPFRLLCGMSHCLMRRQMLRVL